MDLTTIGHIMHDTRCYVKDFPKKDKSSRITESRMYSSAGGSACNTAIVASRLGLRSRVIGNIGDDHFGMHLLKEIHKEDVDTDFIRIKKGDTGRAIVIVNSKAEVQVVQLIGVSEPVRGFKSEGITEARHLHMTGTNIDALERAGRIAGKKGIPVSFDPGRSISRMGYRKLGKIIQNVDYLIVNQGEISELAKKRDHFKASEFIWKKFGITCIIKGGSKPTHVYGAESFNVPTFRVKAIDTIGAGDAFAGGLITALLEGKGLEKSVRFANAVAASEVLFRGTHTLLSRKKLEKRFGV